VSSDFRLYQFDQYGIPRAPRFLKALGFLRVLARLQVAKDLRTGRDRRKEQENEAK